MLAPGLCYGIGYSYSICRLTAKRVLVHFSRVMNFSTHTIRNRDSRRELDPGTRSQVRRRRMYAGMTAVAECTYATDRPTDRGRAGRGPFQHAGSTLQPACSARSFADSLVGNSFLLLTSLSGRPTDRGNHRAREGGGSEWDERRTISAAAAGAQGERSVGRSDGRMRGGGGGGRIPHDSLPFSRSLPAATATAAAPPYV